MEQQTKKQTAVEWLVSQLYRYSFNQPIDLGVWQELRDLAEKAKEIDKQQSLELIELSAELTGIATLNPNDEVAKMTYTNVYNQYYGIEVKKELANN